MAEYIEWADAVALMAFAIGHGKPDAVKIEGRTIIVNEEELEELLKRQTNERADLSFCL